MATVVNFIDTTLQAAAARTVNLPTARVLLTPSAPAFHVAADGTISPTSITFTVTLVDLDGPVTFNSAGGPLSNITAASADLAGATMAGTSATVIASVTVNGTTYTGPCTISKVQDGSPGAPGADGQKNAVARLYQWGSTAPAKPAGTSTFTWASVSNGTYTGSDGWSTAVPANPGTPGVRLYVATAALSAAAAAASSAVSYTAATVEAWSQNGSNGTNGTNGANGVQSAAATVYQWAATIPAGPAGSPTFTWSSQSFGAAPSGWSLTPGASPSAGMTLWAARAQVTDSAANSTTAFNWSSASVMAIGYAGSNGTNGANGQAGASYVTAYCASATGSATSAPAATTGKTSLPAANSGGITGTWSASVPALTAGQYLYQSDGIYDPATDKVTWSTPYWSSLKVATLSAITANLGAINAGSMNLGNGTFTVDNAGNLVCKSITIVDPVTGETVLQAGSALNAKYAPAGTLNSQQQWAEVTGPGRPENDATKGADASNLKVGLGGKNMIPCDTLPASAAPFTMSKSATSFAAEGPLYAGPGDASSKYAAGNAGTVYIHGLSTPTNGTYIDLFVNGAAKFNVQGNKKYEASAVLSTHRCSASLLILMFDAAGAYIGPQWGNVIDQTPWSTDNNGPFPVSSVIFTTPANAATVQVAVRQSNLGQADPFTFTSLWYFGEALVAQTAASSWSPSANSLTDKLSKAGGGILQAPVALQTSGGIVSGNLTWDAAGNRTGGSGTAITAKGVLGHNGTKVTFAIDSVTGKATFADELQAAYGTFGAVSIVSGGYIASGQSAYNTGTGFWLGGAGNPQFSIKTANGASFLCDPANNVLTLNNASITNASLDAFTATLSGNANGSFANGSAAYGTLTANPSGGKAPYSYRWTLSQVSKTGGAGNMVVNSTTAQSASFSGSGTNATLDYAVTCIVTDANGRTVTLGTEIIANHGTPP